MRTLTAALVVVMLGSGCLAESLNQTYLDTQLVSIPGLDGIWRDSTDGSGSVEGEIVLMATDSVTYRAVFITDRGELNEMLVRVARRNGVTFVDIEGLTDDDLTHVFSLADIGNDRIVLRALLDDSLKAIVARAPGAIPHVRRRDRLILTGSPDQVQAFLIDASQKSGTTETLVWHRIPDDGVCNEMPKDTVPTRSVGGGLLRDFGIELYPRRDSTFEVRMEFAMPRVRAIGALFTVDDTIASPITAPNPVLSRANPFMVVTNARIDQRLEIRSIGAGADGDPLAEIYYCHDGFPSSREAVQLLPAPATAIRFEPGPGYPFVRYMWSPVQGATAYEVLWSVNSHTIFRYPGVWKRVLVRDTSFVLSMRNLNEHTWRVRAFAPVIGFGPLSPVQTVPAPKR